MRFFLGVDGGQSSTTALIGDEAGRVLGMGQGGPCNHVGAAEGRAKLIGAVTECVAKACAQAQLDPSQVRYEAACFGMSGGPDDKEALLAEILHADKLVLTHDGSIALSGATAGEPGIAVIGGTGSIVFGRAANGNGRRVPAAGDMFSATKAAPSTSPARLCEPRYDSRKAGDRRPIFAIPCSRRPAPREPTMCCIFSIPARIPVPPSPRWRAL